jgi:opacity protein-like surface antigen
MKSVAITAVLAAALFATAACAPVIEGGPPIALPPGLQETAQIGSITMSSDWVNSTDDFSDTFSDEVHEELKRCMWGTSPVNVRIHIDELHRADRLGVLLNGDGVHTLSGTVEFVDPTHGNRVVGRFPVSVATSAQGRLGGLLGDRQMMVSEEFGRAICDQAFGRNPRDRGPHNATGG